MRKIVLIIAALILLTGCLVNKDVRRKRKALRKMEQAKWLAPSLFSKDTVIIRDTVIIERHSSDTITEIRLHDTTTVINNDRLVVKYFYDTLRQEIHHEAACKEQVKIVEKPIIVEKIRGLTTFEKIKANLPFYTLLLAAVVLAFYLLKGRQPP